MIELDGSSLTLDQLVAIAHEFHDDLPRRERKPLERHARGCLPLGLAVDRRATGCAQRRGPWQDRDDLDLVVGNFPGTFYLFQGEGQGKFAPVPEEMKADDGKPLLVTGHHSDPFVIDWDQDGDLDILSGSGNGGIQWAENRAGPGKPAELAPFQVLIPPRAHADVGEVLKEADIKGPLGSQRTTRP